MNRLTLGAVLGATLLTSLSFPQAIISNGSSVNSVVPMGNASVNVVGGQYIQLNLNAQGAWAHLTLPQAANWTAATHMVAQVKNVGAAPAYLFMALDSGGSGWYWSDTLIPAGQVVSIAVPLNQASAYGLPMWPSLADSSLVQAIGKGDIYKDTIRRFSVWNNDPQGAVSFQFIQVYPATLQQTTSNFIDQYGQQTVSFPGKVTSDLDMQTQAGIDAQLSGQFPFNSDSYGGVAGSGSGWTGRWSTAKQNGKWYILDPAGNRFFSAGVVGAGWSALALWQDRQNLFQAGAIPSQSGPFAEHFATYTNPATGLPGTGYNFYSSNLSRKFGSNWQQLAAQNILRRMRTWGLNTAGPLAVSGVEGSIASAPVVGIAGGFANIPTINGQSMPDVYDPVWTTAVQTVLASKVAALTGNDMNMGLFVDNELPWASHFNETNGRYLLPFSILAGPSSLPAKTRLVRNLSVQYRTISRLNAAWGTNYASWNAMQAATSFNPASVNINMARDMNTFMSQFAVKYFSTIRQTLTNLNYKGLYLGCRFLYHTPDVLAAAKQYCQVISFNAYEVLPNRYRDDIKAVDCPVMISEVGFGAVDQGRISGYNPNISTEDCRVQIYQNYMSEAMTWTNLVGVHWYKWEDDPVSGRMFDNQVHDLGLVSVTDMPYNQLTAAVQQVLTTIHTRLLNP